MPSSRRRRPDERLERRPRQTWQSPEPGNERWRRELDADLMAMGRVWQLLRTGAVRMLGEIGRQY